MQLPFAPKGDHGNIPGPLEGIHPHKKIFLMDGGLDGPGVHIDGFQARTGILRGAAILQLLWLMMASLVAQMQRIHLQCRTPRFYPWVRKIPWRREWQPTPVFLPGESRGQEEPEGLWSIVLDTTE